MKHFNVLIRSLFVIVFVVATATAQQWQQTASSPKGSGITDLVVKQSNGYLFATTGSFNWPNADTGGVHRSTDGGNTWTRVFPAYIARTIALKQDSILFASVWPNPSQTERLYYSTNNGDTWTITWDGGPSNNIFAVAFHPGNPLQVYVGSRLGTATNFNGGTTGSWSVRGNLPFGSWVRDIAISQSVGGVNHIFVAVQHASNPNLNGVYQSTDGGTSYLRRSSTSDTVSSIIIARESTLVAGLMTDVEAILIGNSQGEIRRAFILGLVNFLVVLRATGSEEVAAFFAFRADPFGVLEGLFAATYNRSSSARSVGGGILESRDRGISWRFINEGLPASGKMSAIVGDSVRNRLYAGTFLDQNNGGQIYSRTITTAVRTTSSDLPSAFSLYQNFPNPFNPTTEIKYQISEVSHVGLKVYDVLGREVSTLVNEVQDAGSKAITLDASKLASGVYFYTLRAGRFSATKKFVLMR